MQSYFERVAEVATLSSVMVQVLLSADDSYLNLVPITCESESPLPSLEEFVARQFRPVGVVGLRGSQTACAFKEDLSETVITAIGMAFAGYVTTLLGPDFADQIDRAEVEALNHIFELPDTRLN